MDINLITVVISLVSVIITLWAVIRQTRDNHFSLGVQTLRDLDKEFDNKGIRRLCIELVNHYSKLKSGKRLSPAIFSDYTTVFDFFETIGLLLRRRALDIELVHSSFSYWVIPIWELAEPDIKVWRERNDDNAYYMDFNYLYKNLVKYDARLRKISVRKMTNQELKDFMKGLSE